MVGPMGGDLQPSSTGTGFSGPCKNPNPDFDTKTFACSQYEDPAYTFNHSGHGALYADESFNCIVSGQVVRGDKTSPFYGYVLSADMVSDRIVAFKKGEAPVVAGDVSNISYKEFRNGIVHFAQTALGDIYVCFLNFYGDQQLFKLSHPQLKPASVALSNSFQYKSKSQITKKNSDFILRVNLGFEPMQSGKAKAASLNGRQITPSFKIASGLCIEMRNHLIKDGPIE